MRLTATETARYEDVWACLGDRYAEYAPGVKYLPVFLEHAVTGQTVLDAGCGSGKGMAALEQAGFLVMGCDLTAEGLVPEAAHLPFREACLWHPLRPQLRRGYFDWAYCTDVLEHLPTQLTMLAVSELLAIAGGLFISVSLTPDSAGAWVSGGHLHQTVQPYLWWRDSLGEVGDVVDARDLITEALFVVKPR